MQASAHRADPVSFTHRVNIRGHELTVDEPANVGGGDEGPSPQELLAASLATCMAITMEMYAKRKGWDIGVVDVTAQYTLAERGAPTRFSVEITLPARTTPEQRERLLAIAARCPVHRTLEGEVVVDQHVAIAGTDPVPASPPPERLEEPSHGTLSRT